MSTPQSTPSSAPSPGADNSSLPASELELASPGVAGLLTLRGLARAIGVDAGQLSKESCRAGFPGRQTDSGVMYDPAEVIAWRRANVRTKKSRPAAVSPPDQAAAPQATVSPAAEAPRPSPAEAVPAEKISLRRASAAAVIAADPEEDGELLATLKSTSSSALEISRAAMQIASRRVARAHLAGVVGPNDFDGLKKSLTELRSAEAAYVELAEQRRELVPRGQVQQIVGECCTRLVQAMSVLENAIVTEFSVWLGDPKLTAMDAPDRARLVREFVARTCRSIRTQEADEIEKMIEASYDDGG